MSRASKIAKYLQVATLVGLATILFFWPFFEALAPALDFTKVAGIITAIIAAVVLYFDDRLSQLIRGPSGVISHGTLAECMDEVLRGRSDLKRLRVMATSSEVIEALVASRGVHIKTCDLLLRNYPDGSDGYNQRVDIAIAEWKQLHADGIISELNISRYHAVPSE